MSIKKRNQCSPESWEPASAWKELTVRSSGPRQHMSCATRRVPPGLPYPFSLALGSVICWRLDFLPGNFPSQSEHSHPGLCSFHYTDAIQWPLETGIQNLPSLTLLGTVLKGHSRIRAPHRIDELQLKWVMFSLGSCKDRETLSFSQASIPVNSCTQCPI